MEAGTVAPVGVKAIKPSGAVATITPELANELLNTGVAHASTRYAGGQLVHVLELDQGVLETSDDPIRDNEDRPRGYGVLRPSNEEA